MHQGFGLKKGHNEKTSNEFYLNVVKLKPLQIQKALQKEFSDHEIHLFEIYKVMAKFYSEKRRDISNNAASLYEDL
ncbi:1650_t:CDS:2, partial [Racocetra fulgida]